MSMLKTEKPKPGTKDSDWQLAKLKRTTRAKLSECDIVRYGDTLDDIINRLLEFYHEHKNT